MLKRKFLDKLLNWKKTKDKSCLLVKGARQIGKTFIIDYFGKTEYKSYRYINFIESPQAKDIFSGELSAEEIFKRMTLIYPDIEFVENETLIFLDEIQVCPNARTALKFLALDNRFDIIASGSLLGISYGEITSIPVGYETQIEMFSLDFEEYLWAVGYKSSAINALKEYFDKCEKVPDSVHNTMLKHLREYAVVGGMPAVINSFIKDKHFGNVQAEQQKILDSYFDDISKYASNTEKPKVKNCYISVPKQLAKENKKFQFSVVEKRATARKYENSVEWLRDANLVNLCYNLSLAEFPLSAYEKDDQYKLYISDIGLLVALYGFEMKKVIVDDSLSGFAKGGIYENLIADILIKRGYKINYFRNTNGTLEIDFLISVDAKIIPIEVKANNGSTVSLNKMLEDEKIPYGYKFISGNASIEGKKRILPLYMAMFL